MKTHLTEPCRQCEGTGRVPRPRRRLPNGEIDPFDTLDWSEIVCEQCNGSGAVPLDITTIQEMAPM